VRGRVEALLTARAAANLASLQVEMTLENILRGERARPRRSAAQSARRRSLGFFACRFDTRKYYTLANLFSFLVENFMAYIFSLFFL
jgi:hypothetical protein